MGLRSAKRLIAKNRMAAMGVGRVNRAMSQERDGVKNWRRALDDKGAEAAQMKAGRLLQRMRRDAGLTNGYIKKGRKTA